MEKFIEKKVLHGWRMRFHEVIFEADTTAGKTFDVLLIITILLSVFVAMLDSVRSIHANYSGFLDMAEWFFTILFTVEYALRLICVGRPLMYATSFFGVVDLLGILPTYISLFFPGSHYLAVIRILRVLRVFRVLNMDKYMNEAQYLLLALKSSSRKITVFVTTVLTLVVIFGSLLYMIEGAENGFTSIPKSIYWAIVTLTTVGYGDISPRTGLGQALSAVIMLLGYSIIAVPTGIVTVEMSDRIKRKTSRQACPMCSAEGHDTDAKFCKHCGASLLD